MDTIIKRFLNTLTPLELSEVNQEVYKLLKSKGVLLSTMKLSLSVRLYNVLKHDLDFKDIAQVTNMTRKNFKALKNVGILTLREMDEVLDQYNLTFNSHQYSLDYTS